MRLPFSICFFGILAKWSLPLRCSIEGLGVRKKEAERGRSRSEERKGAEK